MLLSAMYIHLNAPKPPLKMARPILFANCCIRKGRSLTLPRFVAKPEVTGAAGAVSGLPVTRAQSLHYFLRCSNSVMCTMKSNGTKKHGISTSGRRCISPVL